MNRIDWQSLHQPRFEVDAFDQRVDDLWEDMDAIVAHDLHRGCVTSDLIQLLVNKYPSADWFVRTKDMDVEWINSIPEERFRLRFIGAEYVPKRSKIKRWFYGKQINWEVIEELKKLALADAVNKPDTNRWIVALHDDNRLVSLEIQGAHGPIIARSTGSHVLRQPINVGRSSIAFASCIASLLGCYRNGTDTILRNASINARIWTESITENIRVREPWGNSHPSPVYYFRGDHTQILKHATASGVSEPPYEITVNANDLVDSWKRSFDHLGIEDGVHSGKRQKVFHFWRGSSCIDGYVAIRESLRTDLNKLYDAIFRFRSKSYAKSSLNILILGNPGWGKSYLAERMAVTFDLNPILFNLAQLTSIGQVIDCFDAISSLQNQQKGRPVLAFFDEIDSDVAGAFAFSLFLSPILDGTYRRGGRVFYLAPSIWVFAGAQHPSEIQNANKTADFMSRINGPIVTLDFRNEEGRRAPCATEQVYLGVGLLRQTFDDLSSVSKDILILFHDLVMKHGVRSLQQAIRKFKNVQYGRVGRTNLPDYSDISSLIDFPESQYNKIRSNRTKEEFVEIIETPE